MSQSLPISRGRRTSRTSGGPGRSGRSGRSTSTCCRPATTPAPPARTSRRGSALAQGGRFEEAWRTLMADNPLPAVHGRVCYHPCEDSCNRRQLDSAVSIHAVERFLGDLPRSSTAGGFERPRAASGKRVLVVGAGPSRPVGRLPPRAPRARGRDPRRRPAARRHDALRHPRLSHAARGARGRDRQDRGAGRPHRARITRSRTSQAEMQRRPLRCRASSRSARISASGPRSPRATPAGCSTR